MNSRDCEGCYPLHWAAKHGKVDLLGALIPDVGVDAEDAKAKWTPLHYAAHSNKAAVCQWLISHGANKLKKDSHERTALEIASELSYVSIDCLT